MTAGALGEPKEDLHSLLVVVWQEATLRESGPFISGAYVYELAQIWDLSGKLWLFIVTVKVKTLP